MTAPSDDDLLAIWVGSEVLAFAVGVSGATWRYDGDAWTVQESAAIGTDASLRGVWGTSESDLFAVSSDRQVFQWKSDHWDTADADVGFALFGVAGGSGAPPTAVGAGGKISQRANDGSWRESQPVSTMSFPLKSIASRDSLTYAVGSYGVVLRRDGENWSQVRNPDQNAPELLGVWVQPDGAPIAVGAARTILEGNSWTSTVVPEIDIATELRGIWADAETVFVVGNSGVVLQRTAADWSLVPSSELPPAADLNAISGVPGFVMAVGAAGNVWRYSP